MKKMFLITFLVFVAQVSLANSVGKGFLNNHEVEFSIERGPDFVKFNGDFGLGNTNYLITTSGNQSIFKGQIHNKNISMSTEALSGLIKIEGEFNSQPINMSISQNSVASRFSGLITGRELSTHVVKDLYATTRVSGFYQRDLYDLYIYENEGDIIFEGYANGYWTNLKIKKMSHFYEFKGKFANSDVQLRLTKGSIELNEFIEFLLFGFFIPNQPIILLN